MGRLFDACAIHTITLTNRFVRSATWEGMAAPNGAVTPKLIETMTALAKGGVGLIITSHAYVCPGGQAAPWQLGIYQDEQIEGLQTMTAAVHAAGGKIVAQISHAGYAAVEALTGRTPLAVSAFEGLAKSPRREMTPADIEEIMAAYAAAADRAKVSGFDGVQIHAAHGYLLNQSLSPYFNRRRDAYGGSAAHRARFLMDVYHAVRQAVGKDYPVLVKLNSRDFIENGLVLEESLAVADMLVAAGIDAIELSGGMAASGKLSPSRAGIHTAEKEAYFREEARALKKRMSVPLILVGGLRSLEVAEGLLAEGTADFISMCRPFIREPGLINRWKSGDRRRAACISDNQCFAPGREGKGIYCVTAEREQSK